VNKNHPPGDDPGALCDRIGKEASLTWTYLTAGWERRRRPNEKMDLHGLKNALYLETSCNVVLGDPNVYLLPNTNYLRYEFFAGALMVQQLLPVPVAERPALRQTMSAWHSGQVKWRAEMPTEQVELVDHWRKWLRSDGAKRAPIGAELHGEASMFAAASYRICLALASYPIDTAPFPASRTYPIEDSIQTLVQPVEREPWLDSR
jgi:hypothetical protein